VRQRLLALAVLCLTLMTVLVAGMASFPWDK